MKKTILHTTLCILSLFVLLETKSEGEEFDFIRQPRLGSVTGNWLMLVEVVPGETYIVQDSTDLGEWADYFEFTPDRVNHVLSFAPRPNV